MASFSTVSRSRVGPSEEDLTYDQRFTCLLFKQKSVPEMMRGQLKLPSVTIAGNMLLLLTF
jgi:hypothetical protein